MFDGAPPGELIESAPPRVTLRNAFAHPFDSAIAAARTCYAPRLITPEEIADVEALLVGDFFRRDQARGVAGARGGNGGVEWMGESIAEGDARRCGFDKFARTRAVKHARLCSHVGKVFYTGAKDLTERTRQSQTEPERAWRPQRKEQRKCGTDLLVCPRGSIAHKEER